ncbi:MAG: O-antigen polymerase [uncultured bacterium]|nr:MAG: O-antigen polymerase [uncultured bacterium]HCU70992.1 hypothetical protein [Candidatus Moranbacteria bacterium]
MEKWFKKKHISAESVSAIFIIILISLFIAANFVAGFTWPLFILAMAAGFLLSLVYPRSGVLAIVFLTMVWERFFTLQTFFIGKIEYKIYPLDFLLGGVLIGALVQYVFGRIKIEFKKADWILSGFVVLNIIYFVFSFLILKSNAQLAFSSLKNYAFYSLLYFVTIMLFQKIDDIKRLFRFFLSGAAVIVIFIVIGYVGGEGLWSGYTPLSTSGVRKLAFTHGLYLSLAFFPAMLWLIFRRKDEKMKMKMLHLFLLIWIIGIVGTLMRHLWIAMACTFLLLILFLPKEKKKEMAKLVFKLLMPFAIAGIFIFYIASMNPQSNFSRALEKSSGIVSERAVSLVSSEEDESFSWRSLVWKNAYEDFKSNPIFGIGTGERIYVESKNYKDFIEGRNIHNSYLAVLIQLGVLGIAMLLLFIFLNVRSLLFSKRGGQYDFYKFSILSVLAIYILSIPFQPYLETNLLAIFFWIALGLSRILPEVKS